MTAMARREEQLRKDPYSDLSSKKTVRLLGQSVARVSKQIDSFQKNESPDVCFDPLEQKKALYGVSCN